jgi:hypothetical protein
MTGSALIDSAGDQTFFVSADDGRLIVDHIFEKMYLRAPPAGFEPAHTAPEAVALSPELWGLALIWLGMGAITRSAPSGTQRIRSPAAGIRGRSARMSLPARPDPVASRRDPATRTRASRR